MWLLVQIPPLSARDVRRFAEPDKIDGRMGNAAVSPESRPGWRSPHSCEKGSCRDVTFSTLWLAAELVFCFLAALASSVEGDTGSAPGLRDALALASAAVWACQGSGTIIWFCPSTSPVALVSGHS